MLVESTRMNSPIRPFLEQQGCFVLDGGLATTLEANGHDLDDDLWSARLLLEAPEAIGKVHRAFLEAGADCIATASYQASVPGFLKRGLSEVEATGLLRLSVRLAIEARDAFWREAGNRRGRLRPLVAASVGPYGAFLADGSEYTGDYRVDEAALRAFHERRWRLFAESEADLLACETIPSLQETNVLLSLLADTPDRRAWISFSCGDGFHLNDGSELRKVAATCDSEPRLVALGINCTSPEFVPSLIREMCKGTGKPVFVYPNLGEDYDVESRTWVGTGQTLDWGEASSEWFRLGATGVGGCCRVGPRQIAAIRARLGERFAGETQE